MEKSLRKANSAKENEDNMSGALVVYYLSFFLCSFVLGGIFVLQSLNFFENLNSMKIYASCHFVCQAVGAFFFGVSCDLYGRLKSLRVCLFLMFFGTLINALFYSNENNFDLLHENNVFLLAKFHPKSTNNYSTEKKKNVANTNTNGKITENLEDFNFIKNFNQSNFFFFDLVYNILMYNNEQKHRFYDYTPQVLKKSFFKFLVLQNFKHNISMSNSKLSSKNLLSLTVFFSSSSFRSSPIVFFLPSTSTNTSSFVNYYYSYSSYLFNFTPMDLLLNIHSSFLKALHASSTSSFLSFFDPLSFKSKNYDSDKNRSSSFPPSFSTYSYKVIIMLIFSLIGAAGCGGTYPCVGTYVSESAPSYYRHMYISALFCIQAFAFVSVWLILLIIIYFIPSISKIYMWKYLSTAQAFLALVGIILSFVYGKESNLFLCAKRLIILEETFLRTQPTFPSSSSAFLSGKKCKKSIITVKVRKKEVDKSGATEKPVAMQEGESNKGNVENKSNTHSFLVENEKLESGKIHTNKNEEVTTIDEDKIQIADKYKFVLRDSCSANYHDKFAYFNNYYNSNLLSNNRKYSCSFATSSYQCSPIKNEKITKLNFFAYSSYIKRFLRYVRRHKSKIIGVCAPWLLFDIIFYSNIANDLFVSEIRGINSYLQRIIICMAIDCISFIGYFFGIFLIHKMHIKLTQLLGFVICSFVFFGLSLSIYITDNEINKVNNKIKVNIRDFIGASVAYDSIFRFFNFPVNVTTFLIPLEISSTLYRGGIHGLSICCARVGCLLVFFFFWGILPSASSSRVDTFLVCTFTSVLATAFTVYFTPNVKSKTFPLYLLDSFEHRKEKEMETEEEDHTFNYNNIIEKGKKRQINIKQNQLDGIPNLSFKGSSQAIKGYATLCNIP